VIPSGRHARGEQRLDLGRQVQIALVHRVEQRLDAEAIPGGEERVAALVPQRKGKFAAQLRQAVRPGFFVEVQRNLAVRPGREPVPAPLEFAPDPFEIIKLAVHHDTDISVLAHEWLIARRQIDDAQPRVPEPHAPVG
jgi:hypothetical protein